MGALDVNLHPLSVEELEPHVVIAVANPDSFAKFEMLMNESGYPCYIFNEIHDVLTYTNAREGIIVFLEWGLPGTNVKDVAKMLGEQMGNDVIVFSGSDDIKTRAEMGSCGFQQTIQAPFTEKNFLMAVQKIKSDRQSENEKIIRKLKHQERMTAQNESSVQASGPLNLVQQGASNADSSGMQSFSGAGATGGHDQFGGAGFDGGHALHKGEAQNGGGMYMPQPDSNTGDGHSHFRGEIPAELQAKSEKPDSASYSATQEASNEDSDLDYQAEYEAHREAQKKAEDELVDDLVHQLDDMDEEAEDFTENDQPVQNSPQLTDQGPDPEVLAEFRKLEEEHFGAEEPEQVNDSEEVVEEEPQLTQQDPEKNWEDVELPTLPQIGSGPQAFMEQQKETQQKIIQKSREESFSSRDWLLMLSGIVLMLLLCSYFLAEVFIFPMMRG